MLHEGGPVLIHNTLFIRCLRTDLPLKEWVHIALLGFVKDLALHLGRSPSIHSNGYESSSDRPTCLTSSFTKSKPFVQHAG